MKTISRIALILILPALLSCSHKPEANFEITGKIPGVNAGKIYLRKFSNKLFVTVDSATIQDGSFHFASNLPLPELYGLSIDTTHSPLFVFLDKNDKITVDIDTADISKSVIGNSVENDIYAYFSKNEETMKIDSLLKAHPKSIAATYILYRHYSWRLSPGQIDSNVALIDTALYHLPYITVLRDLANTLRKVQPGNPAPDFTCTDTTGTPVTLSSQFGHYLLVDFWASWCSPCRHENPNYVRIYQKYHAKGFDILGVSLDKKKESWTKAIKADNLSWKQVSDLAFWNSAPAKLYGVRAIPSNVLIDPKGIIIARNIMGEELENKVAELLKKK